MNGGLGLVVFFHNKAQDPINPIDTLHMNMNEINALDLNLFLALNALLRERNVTRAAVELGITQSAMSHRLKNLRQVFEDPLLVRGEEGYLLTPTAQRLEPYVRRGLREFRLALENRNSFQPQFSERTFCLLTYDYVDYLVIPHLLKLLQEQAPGVRLKIRPLQQNDWAHALEQGEADLAIGTWFSEDMNLKKRQLFEDHFLTAVGRSHPYKQRILDLETYLSWPHALISTTGKGPSAVDHALQNIGRERRVLVQLPSFTAAPMLLLQSNLFLTAPRFLLKELARHLPIRLYPPPVDLNQWSLNMAWHERFQSDAAHAWLRDLISDAAMLAKGQEDVTF